MYFYFEQLLRTALTGINATIIVPTMVQIGGVLLLATLLFNVYEAFMRGGDARILAVGALKYLIIGLVLLNYHPLFLGVNTMFNQVAEFIATIGPGGMDVFDTWRKDLSDFALNSPSWKQSLFPLVIGTPTAIVSLVLLLIGFVAYAITYAIFCIFYAFYGSVLYVFGPIVLGLYPALSTTPLARTYLTNLIVFHSWGLIYAVLGALMAAINLGSVSQVLAAGDAAGFFAGVGSTLLLSLASILFALCIALIPYLARRIVQGDVGSTMFAVAGAAATAAMVAATASINMGSAAAGFGGGGGGGVGGGAAKASSAADKSSGTPPARPPERSDSDTAKTERTGDSGQAPVAPAEPVMSAKSLSAPAAKPDAEQASVPETPQSNESEKPQPAALSPVASPAPSHGAARSSRPHWRVYRPMDVVAMASFHAGSAVGWGASKVGQAFRPRSHAGSKQTDDE